MQWVTTAVYYSYTVLQYTSQLFINLYCDKHGFDRLPQGELMISKHESG